MPRSSQVQSVIETTLSVIHTAHPLPTLHSDTKYERAAETHSTPEQSLAPLPLSTQSVLEMG